MKMELGEIAKGFKYYIFKDEAIEGSAQAKLNQCEHCPLRNQFDCSRTREAEAIRNFNYKGEPRFKGIKYKGCGCVIAIKVRSNSKCPLGKF